MKRKILLSFTAVLLICAATFTGFFAAYSANAETAAGNKLSDFTEDFESYQTGAYIENEPSFAEVWANNVLLGGEAQDRKSVV